MESFKKCNKCGVVKHPSQFYEGKGTCKTCYIGEVTERHYKREYNMTLKEYDEMLRKQLNKCAICGVDQDDSPNKFHVDHCHTTGQVRGLLCSNCNIGLGHFRHNPKLMKTAGRYIDYHGD
tara:strand:- start:11943 stop:12305 length:363 start_codon:yes stop_codon:yes gene_type:complete